MQELISTQCAICGSFGNSTQVFNSSLGSQDLDADLFSARRVPDRLHYAWVRCLKCGLLRSDPILNLNLAELYRKSTFDYSSEQQSLADTYEEVLKVALEQADVTRGGVLEVGGGNGFFLERALTLGFKSVVGVEPSTHAIASAREDIRPSMIASPMVPGLVESNSVDVGAMFHVLDHLVDPKETLTNCLDAIKTGGIMVVAVHNEKSWSARLFGRRSPIFDVEHTYLYSKKTLKGILEKSGFEVVLVKGYKNRYSLRYLVHLTPMPPRLKKALLSSRLWSHALNLRFWIPLGNIMAVGIKR